MNFFEDKTLQCRDCGEEFVFTAGEQQFFQEKGFTNTPTRCPACRKAKRRRQGGGNRGRSNRPMYDVRCDNCGRMTKVPFEPDGRKEVYCSDCFRERRQRTAW